MAANISNVKRSRSGASQFCDGGWGRKLDKVFLYGPREGLYNASHWGLSTYDNSLYTCTLPGYGEPGTRVQCLCAGVGPQRDLGWGAPI
eukprot:2444966-Rhodomonas_salina.1